MSEKIIVRKPVSDVLSVSGIQDTSRTIPTALYEALVVDVIFDHTHPEYFTPDGYNVGSIKVRIFEDTQTVIDSELSWADPIDNTIQEYPLIGELVTLQKIRDNLYYTRKIPIAHKIQENAILNLNDALQNRSSNTLANAINKQQEILFDIHKFGEYYRPDSRVRPLKHFEGDKIFQGRMGQSIRFGSSQMDPSSDGLAPNVIIRSGQGKDIENKAASTTAVYGVLLEDINKDPSSLWMTSDQIVPFTPATIDAGSFLRSAQEPPTIFDGAQTIINSDRIILNAKNNQIMLFSSNTINLNSYSDITLDTDANIFLSANEEVSIKMGGEFTLVSDADITISPAKNIKISSGENTSLLGKNIFIGSIEDNEEPIVGGKTLAETLETLVKIIANAPVLAITSSGPAKLSPAVKAQLENFITSQLKNKTDAVFNSKNNFVSLENEEVDIEQNEFESGKPVEADKNTWNLTDDYYKVV
jgi:hypothetical protein